MHIAQTKRFPPLLMSVWCHINDLISMVHFKELDPVTSSLMISDQLSYSFIQLSHKLHPYFAHSNSQAAQMGGSSENSDLNDLCMGWPLPIGPQTVQFGTMPRMENFHSLLCFCWKIAHSLSLYYKEAQEKIQILENHKFYLKFVVFWLFLHFMIKKNCTRCTAHESKTDCISKPKSEGVLICIKIEAEGDRRAESQARHTLGLKCTFRWAIWGRPWALHF